MAFRPTVFTWVLLAAAAIAAWLATVAWRRRATGGRSFAVMMGGVALWCLADAVQFGVTTMAAYRLWTNLELVGSMVVTTAALVFALQYAGFDRWVTRRLIGLLALEPVVTAGIMVTNPLHHLLWRYVGPMRYDPVTDVPAVAGPWWTFHLGYTYAVIAVTLGVLGLFFLRTHGVYRRQVALMILGALVPLAMNLLWQAGASPVAGVSLASMAFVATGLLFAVSLYRYDLLDLSPVASHEVVQRMRDGVVTVDREGRVADANPVARRLLGDGDVVGQPAATVVPNYEAVAAGEDVDDVAFEVDGERRYYDVGRSPSSDAAGERAGHVLLLRDVTERRLVEKRYQLLIENASDLVFVLQPDGTISYVSPSVRNVLGYEPADFERASILDVVHPEDREAVIDRLGDITGDAEGDLQAEFRVRDAEGSYRVMESRGRDLLDDPVVDGIVVNARDVTRRNRRERALRRQNEQLEEFASVISHDLRNPLTVARGYADVLADEYDDERLDRVIDAHRRMDELLDDLLALAREGRSVDEVEPVDLEEVVRLAWATADTGDAALSVKTDEAVLADESRLRQLFENLFRNAAEHGGGVTVTVGSFERVAGSPLDFDGETERSSGDATGGSGAASGDDTDGLPSSPTATVEGDRQTPAAAGGNRSDGGLGADDEADEGEDRPAYLGIFVADDGPGVPPDERASVFEVGVSSADDGTGFGLAIVQRIAEAHGWGVDLVESEAGGARFEFTEVERA